MSKGQGEEVEKMGRKPILISAAQEILKEYSDRVTIRQLFYQFVTRGIIKNSERAYGMLDRQMGVARRDGRISFGAFVDRTRHSFLGEQPNPSLSDAESILNDGIYVFEHASEIALEQLKQSYLRYSLPYWHWQPVYVEVWVEKEALANLFEPLAQKYQVTFVPCKGYSSLSLLYDCSMRFRAVPSDREIHILYFGDFDMRGLNIQESIERSLLNDFHIQAKVIRCALTREQIDQFRLPPNPAKSTDAMARGWIETHGNVAWELDALEPKVLEQLVEKAILSQISQAVLNERERAVQKTRDWIAVQVEEYLRSHDVEDHSH